MTAKKDTAIAKTQGAQVPQNGAQGASEGVATILQAAKALEMPAEDVGKLLEMHLKLEARKEERAFLAAFAAFQEECPEIHKLDTAHNGKYAKLPRIAKAIRPAMKANGLSFRHEIEDTDKGIKVTCIVSHKDGHNVKASMTAAADTSGSKSAIQAKASTLTYLERYTLGAALGIVAGDADDDGDGPAVDVKCVNKAQAATIAGLCDQLPPDITGRMLGAYGVEDIASLPVSVFKEVCHGLNKHLDKIAKQEQEELPV